MKAILYPLTHFIGTVASICFVAWLIAHGATGPTVLGGILASGGAVLLLDLLALKASGEL